METTEKKYFGPEDVRDLKSLVVRVVKSPDRLPEKTFFTCIKACEQRKHIDPKGFNYLIFRLKSAHDAVFASN